MTFIRKATEVAIVFLFVIMVSAVFLQFVARYAFNSPPSWTEELARYCQVYIIFPLGGLLMFIEAVLSTYKILVKRKVSTIEY